MTTHKCIRNVLCIRTYLVSLFLLFFENLICLDSIVCLSYKVISTVNCHMQYACILYCNQIIN